MAVFLRYILYAVICVCLGCGSRKVQTSTSKTEQKDITIDTSKGNVSKNSSSSSETGNSVQNNITNEKQETRTREIFAENGTLKERITELLNSKSTDNTISTYYINTRSYIHSDSVFNNTHYIDRTITINTKEKAISTNRNGLYWTIGIVALIGLAFLLKPWAR